MYQNYKLLVFLCAILVIGQVQSQTCDQLQQLVAQQNCTEQIGNVETYCNNPACIQISDYMKNGTSCPQFQSNLTKICDDKCIDSMKNLRFNAQLCGNASIETAKSCKACSRLNTTEYLENFKKTCSGGGEFFQKVQDSLKDSFFICTKLPATGSSAGNESNSQSTTFIIVGALVAIVVILVAVAYRLKLKNDISKRNFDYINGETNNNYTNRSNNNDGFGKINNDIRFDEELAQYRIPQHEIQNVSTLKKGGYGVVFHATFGKEEVAMKQLIPSKSKDLDAIQDFMNEIRLCSRLEHPKIVKFIGISWSTIYDVAVLSEFMTNGDVNGILQKDAKKSESQRTLQWYTNDYCPTTKGIIAAEIADALVYLHSFQPTIIHRDLKSKNVLLSASWESKLSDFGISRVTSLEETMTSNIGTVAWIAPEVLIGGKYTEKADIYSFGVLLCELDRSEAPYTNMLDNNKESKLSNARIAMMVSEGSLRPTFSNSIPAELLELGQECLSFNESDRPTAMLLSYKLHNIIKTL